MKFELKSGKNHLQQKINPEWKDLIGQKIGLLVLGIICLLALVFAELDSPLPYIVLIGGMVIGAGHILFLLATSYFRSKQTLSKSSSDLVGESMTLSLSNDHVILMGDSGQIKVHFQDLKKVSFSYPSLLIKGGGHYLKLWEPQFSPSADFMVCGKELIQRILDFDPHLIRVVDDEMAQL